MPSLDLTGVLAPLPTAFDDHGDVFPHGLRQNLARWRASRLHGVLVLGSNGEAALLDENESDAVIAAVRDDWPRDRMLIAGVGRESTRATVRAASRAADLGADAVLVRPPAAFRAQMTTEALRAHYTTVADASPVPVVLYNLPGVVGYSLTADLVASLATHPNIAGIKETSPDLERLGLFTSVESEGFGVLTGWAPVLLPALTMGAAGGILAVANLVPDACVAICDAVRAGRHRDAAVLQRRLTPLARLVSSVHGVPGLKFAMDRMGYYGGPVRAPLVAAPAAAREAIAAAIEAWNGLPQEV